MAWFRRKPDPISDRARALERDIAALEAQIRELDGQLHQAQQQPKLRSTAVPGAPTLNRPAETDRFSSGASSAQDPVFEEVDLARLQPHQDAPVSAGQFNELGVRKYDFPALIRRWRSHFRGPATTNPKLVSYLAAGGIQGLRPMRYEKRVARNRFIALAIVLFLVLLGIITVFVKQR